MFTKLTPHLIKLTTQVGKSIMSFYKKDIDIKIKTNQTPVTIADETAHKLIVDGLNKLTPDIPILSEEGENISFAERSKWNEYWLVDPLDGTREFIKRTGEFCICLAYIKNNEVVFGMIYAPLTKTHYYSTKNSDAFMLKNNKLQILKTSKSSAVLKIVIGHYSSNNVQLKKYLKKQNHSLNELGSALKFCAIAEGLYDHYPRFGPSSEWDIAAGACILCSAGGNVVDKHGNQLRFNTKKSLISPVFFASGRPLEES